ncbi:dUTP diphosphatase [uncultured Ruminococcus sp.]|uniref:dUTP diphosphatase n=1 Tax=uncultured Ruminococcus sp. TaxID=165186 RepID=UPI0025E565E8|nr:dUTP diphosphatase [uncultured Ruminococcus sp.]
MKLLIKKLNEKAIVPARQTQYSAGYDLCACTDEPIVIKAGETAKIHTGISAEIEGTKDVVLLIYARSSLATKFGIAPANCVGVVDWDYRGEIICALHNSSKEDYTINHGDRIAQMVVTPVFTPEVEVRETLSDTTRGAGGFGSTGK